jgi:hypothetical protein
VRERAIIFNAPGGWPGALVLAALIVLWLVWFYRRLPRPTSRRLRLVLGLLKLAAFAVALILWLRPAMKTTRYEVRRPLLVMMTDVSRSMDELRDGPDERSRSETLAMLLEESREELAQLNEQYELRRVYFARGVLPAADPPPEDRAASAYGDSLESVRQMVAGQGCAGIILLGDGSSNWGTTDPVDAAISLGAQELPVYAVGLGSSSPVGRVRDVKVVELRCPQTAFAGALVPVEGRVRVQGFRGRKLSVRLTVPGHQEQRTTIQAVGDDEVVPVEFQVRPVEEGEYKISLRAEWLQGEILDANNVSSTWMKVVKGGVRVTYLDRLRPESKFVMMALSGAEQLNVRRLIWPPGADVDTVAATDWSQSDVVIIGDVTALSFGERALSNLAEAVQNGEAGLLLLVGEQSGGESGFARSVLEKALPVVLPAGGVRWEPGPARVRPTPEQLADPLLRIAGERGGADPWVDLAPLDGLYTGLGVKRSGRELLSVGDLPVLAVQQYGRGRTAVLTVNTTFRWFFTPEDTQESFRRFWRQLVLWLGGIDERPGSRVWISIPSRRLQVGDPVPLALHVLGERGAPVPDAEAAVEVRREGAPAPQGVPVAYEARSGTFEGVLKLDAPGDYAIRGRAARGQDEIGEDRLMVTVQPFDRELDDPVADHSLLRRIAEATRRAGGRFVPWQRLRLLLAGLSEKGRRVVVPRTEINDVWDRPWLFAALVLFAVAEWALRRLKGLI